jgi:hypothetical protein
MMDLKRNRNCVKFPNCSEQMCMPQLIKYSRTIILWNVNLVRDQVSVHCHHTCDLFADAQCPSLEPVYSVDIDWLEVYCNLCIHFGHNFEKYAHIKNCIWRAMDIVWAWVLKYLFKVMTLDHALVVYLIIFQTYSRLSLSYHLLGVCYG